MKKYTYIIVLCLTVAGCWSGDNKETIVLNEFDGLAQKCFDSTARIRSRKSIGTCSAIRYLKKVDGDFVESSKRDAEFVEFESNYHVLGSDPKTEHCIDVFSEGDLVASEICHVNQSFFEPSKSKDIATTVVALKDLDGIPSVVPYAPYGSNPIQAGDKLFSIGCSDGRDPRSRCGNIIKIDASNSLVFYSPVAIPGDSGGGLYKFSSTRNQWELVGRTAWAIKQDGQWVGLAMTSDRVADIKAGRVSLEPNLLPEGAIPISEINDFLPVGAVTCDQFKATLIQEQSLIDPKPLPILNTHRRWKFPLRQEDIDEDKRFVLNGKRDWTILGGVFDFVRSLVMFAFWIAVILAILGAWIAPTILSPLKYNWPILAVQAVVNKLRNIK